MNVVKFFKEISSDHLIINGLQKYKGQSAEVIILINEKKSEKRSKKRDAGLRIINKYSGKLSKWTRDSLYER
jgi:hypothetical protein